MAAASECMGRIASRLFILYFTRKLWPAVVWCVCVIFRGWEGTCLLFFVVVLLRLRGLFGSNAHARCCSK